MKVSRLKHRRVVTPWWRSLTKVRYHRRLVLGPLSYALSRSVAS